MESNADHKALKLARMAHQTAKPIATILFGSRARGDHQLQSDVDILLLTETEREETHDEKLIKELEKASHQLYGRSTPVQIVSMTTETWQDQEQFYNSIVTGAARDGTLAGGDPSAIRSRYTGPNPPPPLFQWEGYKYELAAALISSKGAVRDLHDSGVATDIPEPEYLPPEMNMIRWSHADRDRALDSAREETRAMIHHALNALLETTGWNASLVGRKAIERNKEEDAEGQALPKTREMTFHATLRMLEAQGVIPPATTLPLEDYARAGEGGSTEAETFYRQGVEDYAAIKKAATRRKSAISRAAAKAGTQNYDPSGRPPEEDPRPLRRFAADLNRQLIQGLKGYYYNDAFTQEGPDLVTACHDNQGWIKVIGAQAGTSDNILDCPAWLLKLGPEGQVELEWKNRGTIRWYRPMLSQAYLQRMNRQVKATRHLLQELLPHPGDYAMHQEQAPNDNAGIIRRLIESWAQDDTIMAVRRQRVPPD